MTTASFWEIPLADPVMRHHAADESLVNALAVLVLIGIAVAGVHWGGYDTGIPHWLACTAGRPLLMGYGPGLITLAATVGLLLALVPMTRSFGLSLLVLAVVGMVLIEGAANMAAGYCT